VLLFWTATLFLPPSTWVLLTRCCLPTTCWPRAVCVTLDLRLLKPCGRVAHRHRVVVVCLRLGPNRHVRAPPRTRAVFVAPVPVGLLVSSPALLFGRSKRKTRKPPSSGKAVEAAQNQLPPPRPLLVSPLGLSAQKAAVLSPRVLRRRGRSSLVPQPWTCQPPPVRPVWLRPLAASAPPRLPLPLPRRFQSFRFVGQALLRHPAPGQAPGTGWRPPGPPSERSRAPRASVSLRPPSTVLAVPRRAGASAARAT